VVLFAALAASLAGIEERAEALCSKLRAGADAAGVGIEVRAVNSAVGGGAAPDLALPSRALALKPSKRSAESLARSLREASPPVIARIENDVVLLDLRTVLQGEDDEIERILLGAWKGITPSS